MADTHLMATLAMQDMHILSFPQFSGHVARGHAMTDKLTIDEQRVRA